ncbi:hypothetical protein MYP_1194 [Sporocytophaga myxococcoides]|uniref:Uncharacterized protein n=1 Tax=Sporocytophaga myxococcoides TaxID=153721 RepID=A0A098LAJ3_9BACT|nr:T9SS type A sorting domain-containing protein [Sporocytophaga myxococcoides]GAL83966.1 hypothetical protein MYP_1194 [Sporocytophaga myxococcoides]
MKKIYILLVIFIAFGAKAQENTWANFPINGVAHPFKSLSQTAPPQTDIYGNIWILEIDALLKIKGTDTARYTNFPNIPNSSINAISLTISGDKVAFSYYGYRDEGGITKFTSYLGFYDGTDLGFYSEVYFGGDSVSSLPFIQIRQTNKYIWIVKGDKLIQFDKTNNYKIYPNNESQLPKPLVGPTLLQNNPGSVILTDKGEFYVFEDTKNDWEKLLPADSPMGTLQPSCGILYLAGKNKVYTYFNNTLQSFDAPITSLGGPYGVSITEFKPGVFSFSYSKGFVLVSNGKVFVRFFADFTENNEVYRARFDGRSPLSNAFLDNGTLILRYTSETSSRESIYFSLFDDELKFEEKRSYNHFSFLYKKSNGENLFHFIEFDQTESVPLSLVVINNNDTTRIPLPKPLQRLDGIAGDSNFIWLKHTAFGEDSLSAIWRMRRDQNIIKGIIYYDINKNGIQDPYEFGVSKYPLTINPSGITIFPDRNGNFSFVGSVEEVYTMEIQGTFDYISTTLPYTMQNSGENKIGITVANPEPEICTNFFTPWPRCETIGMGSIKVENTGLKGIELIKLTLIGDPLAQINSLDAVSSKTDTLKFEISEFLPLDAILIPFEIHFPGGDKVGEILNFKLIADIYSNESIVSSTFDNISTIVRCSYDPNDKSVTPAGIGEEHLTPMNSALNYLIRFENTGNDTAYTVIVYDTLDLNLNLSTFNVLGSSHPVITEISKEGVVAFHFENIMLPDSTTNKEKAQGFVRFSVEPKKDLKEGTIIKNKAGIVFDKNEPILTNTVFNTFATPVITSYRDKTEKAGFLYPNPAKDMVYIRTDEKTEVFVYDFTGKLILQNKNTSINTAGWNEGLYIFKLADSKGNIQGVEKVIITK